MYLWLDCKTCLHFCCINRQLLSHMESSVRNAANLTKLPPTYLDVLILKAKVQLVGPMVGPLPLRWMDEMTRILTSNLQQYLLGRGILQRADIIDPKPGYIDLTKYMTSLAGTTWSKAVLQEYRRPSSQYLSLNNTLNIQAVGLMCQLLILTHQYNNCYNIVHWNLECSPLNTKFNNNYSHLFFGMV